MILALKQTIILGLTTNIPYMLDILQEEHFRKGETTTNYLAEHFDGWSPSFTLADEDLLAIAAVELLATGKATAIGSGEAKPSFDPWNEPTAWRNR